MKRVWTVLVITGLLTLAIAATVGHCQELGKWRTAHDKPYTDDKGFHMMGSYALCSTLDNTMRLDYAILLTWATGLLWEVKDAYVPCEIVPYFGGDGFSRYDLMADYLGTFGYVLINYIVFHRKGGKYDITPFINSDFLALQATVRF